jgi:hypothetical protein
MGRKSPNSTMEEKKQRREELHLGRERVLYDEVLWATGKDCGLLFVWLNQAKEVKE